MPEQIYFISVVSVSSVFYCYYLFTFLHIYQCLLIYCRGHAAYGSAVKLNQNTSNDIVKGKADLHSLEFSGHAEV